MAKIKCIIKRPDEEYGHMCNISNISTSLENLQKTVEGYIETSSIRKDLVIICNEEGKLMGLEKNMKFGMDYLVGTIIVIGVNGDDFDDIPITFKEWKELVDKWRG